ncbi:sulfotransferase 1C4-like [Penaeus japonicus]|uniref:sulfotransferase 1C4-like n=1 Tax=Penaeus japonicus TaxID=27405 RepID=UPI001C710D42|nr:sulfotransferase 1C4-like [Penaeus japonicus]XP_042858261.1 sulfotransferase 1C4-like [Penaeus japonicus]XP_042858262.1 sulfotransferase 1C4-like [Penaeus japonicus]XP_042858263.1 sulfotransferase 1C4-like [Penaeus japonicus]
MASITERTAAPLPLPFEVEDVPEDEIKRYLDLGFEEYTQLVRTKPIPSYFRPAYARLASAFYHFEFRPDDIVVLTYPKSGTSWTSELVWALKNPGALHLAEEVPSSDRVFFIDMDMLRPTRAAEDNPVYRRFVAACPEGRVEDGVQLQLAAAHKGPRIIKTHLRFDLLRQDLLDTCKVVYTIRNPKDTCVSYFHHSSNNKWHAFKGEFAHFAEAFMGNGILYGSYWEHVRQAWQRKGHRNLHVMFYENMKADIHGELRNLANFLQLDRDDDQLKTVADHASFDSMRSRHERVNVNHGIRNFFRKGQVGDWKNAATGDLNERMDAWIRENSHGIDIPFRYD